MSELTQTAATKELSDKLDRLIELLEGVNDKLHWAGVDHYSNHWLLSQLYWETKLAQPRYQESRRLVAHGQKTFSQNDEDGIIAEIFRRIGTQSKTFVEIGVQPRENNTLCLLASGWRGLWLDANQSVIMESQQEYKQYLKRGLLRLLQAKVDAGNINRLLGENSLSNDIDLLSIDVDGNDFYLLRALDFGNPRAIMIEYNAAYAPPLSFVQEEATAAWDGTNHYGASLKALEKLGASKGYCLVGCCFAGVNAFFVRDDLVKDRFLSPFTAENHYEPVRFRVRFDSGHPPRLAEFHQD